MQRITPLFLSLLALPILLGPASDIAAHSPEDSYSARADLRVDEQRGLRVRTWFEVPESSKAAQGDAEAAVSHLAECLTLTLSGEPLAGTWRTGDDPKHGLSNGSHVLYALEFEPKKDLDEAKLDVTLVIGCFPGEDLSFSASARARSPWRVESESLPAKGAHRHGHGAGSDAAAGDSQETQSRTAQVVFSRRSI